MVWPVSEPFNSSQQVEHAESLLEDLEERLGIQVKSQGEPNLKALYQAQNTLQNFLKTAKESLLAVQKTFDLLSTRGEKEKAFPLPLGEGRTVGLPLDGERRSVLPSLLDTEEISEQWQYSCGFCEGPCEGAYEHILEKMAHIEAEKKRCRAGQIEKKKEARKAREARFKKDRSERRDLAEVFARIEEHFLEEEHESKADWFKAKRIALEACGSLVGVKKCGECQHIDEGSLVAVSTCKVRLCTSCQRKRAEVMKRIVDMAMELIDKPRMVTLTVKNGWNLKERVKHLVESFKRLRRRDFWKDKVRGGLAFMEVTFDEEKGWHPHFHVMVDSKFMNVFELSSEWNEVTGDSSIVDIRLAWDARELAKYVTKVGDLLKVKDPVKRMEIVRDYMLGMKRVRMMVAFGNLYGQGFREEAKKWLKEEGKKKVEESECLNCGSVGKWLYCLIPYDKLEDKLALQEAGFVGCHYEVPVSFGEYIDHYVEDS